MAPAFRTPASCSAKVSAIEESKASVWGDKADMIFFL
jgi:hypothetical protein